MLTHRNTMASSDNSPAMNSAEWETVTAQDHDEIEESNNDLIAACYYYIGQDLSDKNISSPRPELCECMTDEEDGYDSFMDSEDNLLVTKGLSFSLLFVCIVTWGRSVTNHYLTYFISNKSIQTELTVTSKDESCAGFNNQISQPLSTDNNNNQNFGKYHFIPNKSLSFEEFQRRLPLQSMTEDTINKTDWCNINISNNNGAKNGIKLKIWTKDWIKSCCKSLQTKNLPVLPIIVDDDLTEWVKIIYIESKNVYVGIQYGHKQKELLSLISYLTESNDDTSHLPQDLMILMMQFCTKLKVKSICLDPNRVYNGHKAFGLDKEKSISSNKFNKFKENWVNNFEICDISTICDELSVKAIHECFDEHDIDPVSVSNYTRRDFTHLLKTYGVKLSVGLKIWKNYA